MQLDVIKEICDKVSQSNRRKLVVPVIIHNKILKRWLYCRNWFAQLNCWKCCLSVCSAWEHKEIFRSQFWTYSSVVYFWYVIIFFMVLIFRHARRGISVRDKQRWKRSWSRSTHCFGCYLRCFYYCVVN